MEKRSFIEDILEQPQILEKALSSYPQAALDSLIPKIQNGDINRIVLAGHGSSYNALYPAFIHLSKLPIPVSIWQTAELLHYGMNQIDSKTLVCLNSQSGSSAEIKRLVADFSTQQPAFIVAVTNYPSSPLGAAGDITIPLCAGEEHGVAVKTYTSSMSLLILFAVQLTGGDFGDVLEHYRALYESCADFLYGWEEKLVEYNHLFFNSNNFLVVGRGPSMGSALNIALNQKEAVWKYTEGMNAAEFRHGPLELADEDLSLFVLEGDSRTRMFNEVLAKEVQEYGSSVYWVGNHPPEGIECITTPEVPEIFQPVADIIPLQIIAQAMANQKNKEAGAFRHIGKVVLVE